MKSYHLIHGDIRIPAGQVAPTYDPLMRAWRTTTGLIAAEEPTVFSIDVEEIEAEPTYRLQISPVEFKMLFSPQERLAIRQAREYSGEDETLKTLAAMVDDWWTIVDDPRLTTVDLSLSQTQAGLDMLVPAGILNASRRAEIGLGLPVLEAS